MAAAATHDVQQKGGDTGGVGQHHKGLSRAEEGPVQGIRMAGEQGLLASPEVQLHGLVWIALLQLGGTGQGWHRAMLAMPPSGPHHCPGPMCPSLPYPHLCPVVSHSVCIPFPLHPIPCPVPCASHLTSVPSHVPSCLQPFPPASHPSYAPSPCPIPPASFHVPPSSIPSHLLFLL